MLYYHHKCSWQTNIHCPRLQIEKPFHYSVCAYIYISSVQLLQLNLNCIYLFLMCFLLGPISKCPEELPVINAAYRIVMQSYIPDLLLAFKLLWRVCTDVLFKDYFFIYISWSSHTSQLVLSCMHRKEYDQRQPCLLNIFVTWPHTHTHVSLTKVYTPNTHLKPFCTASFFLTCSCLDRSRGGKYLEFLLNAELHQHCAICLPLC